MPLFNIHLHSELNVISSLVELTYNEKQRIKNARKQQNIINIIYQDITKIHSILVLCFTCNNSWFSLYRLVEILLEDNVLNPTEINPIYESVIPNLYKSNFFYYIKEIFLYNIDKEIRLIWELVENYTEYWFQSYYEISSEVLEDLHPVDIEKIKSVTYWEDLLSIVERNPKYVHYILFYGDKNIVNKKFYKCLLKYGYITLEEFEEYCISYYNWSYNNVSFNSRKEFKIHLDNELNNLLK